METLGRATRRGVRKRPLLRGAALAAVVAAGGCGVLLGLSANGPARVVHEEGEGPLAMLVGGGGKALAAPPSPTWWATSGWAHPCVEGVDEVTITAVRHEAVPQPLQIRTLFLFTPPLSERPAG